MFQISLYASLILSAAGLLFQVYRLKKRGSLWMPKLKLSLNLKPALFNTIFQSKLFCASKTRWVIHFLVFAGFTFLVFFHALDELTSFNLFQYYQPTLDPFQFLRNLAGFLVLTGCIGFLFRRLFKTRINRENKTKYKEIFSIILILLVIISGFMLETVKIISEPAFLEMVEDYSDLDEDTDLNALMTYWEKNYHVVFKEMLIITEDTLEKGRLLNDAYCLDCHSKIKSAFVSKTFAMHLGEIANSLNHYRADNWLYPIHYLLSFLMLICLPFSRFFHILMIPFASATHKMTSRHFQKETVSVHPATFAACTNCGICSEVCSVYPNFLITKNKQILPHSKIESAGKMIFSGHLNPEALNQLQLGNDECTMCNNCTDICPSGIDLQGLWKTLPQTLQKMGYPDNYTFVKDKALQERGKKQAGRTYELTRNLAGRVYSFENCVQCTICTNVCPVVAYAGNDNDMTPQQIMNLLRLGEKQMAAETRMVWNCLTCYLCQEHCPSEIKVADIILELRNISNQTAGRLKIMTATNKANKL
ncbi:MAG: 4Fe-4S dicluster domain-containing protein [Desulfobacterales bacterium]|nr:4Fe-4S dicluster domain-containing protein [Desulfobacterales bacterium]